MIGNLSPDNTSQKTVKDRSRIEGLEECRDRELTEKIIFLRRKLVSSRRNKKKTCEQ